MRWSGSPFAVRTRPVRVLAHRISPSAATKRRSAALVSASPEATRLNASASTW